MSNDEVYEFVPMVTGMYTITVTPAADFDPTVYVVSDCASVDTSCIGANQEWGDGLVEVLDVVLTAGTAYYVIVDGWTNYSEDSGTYTIEISPVCTPDCAGRQCGTDGCMGSCGTCTGGLLCDPTGHCVISITGDVCPTPFVVAPGSLPYAGAGDTSDAMNDYSFASSVCPGVTYACGGGSKDEVFRFMPTASGTYTITVDPTFDSVLYVVTNCTSITSLTCLGAEDAVGSAPEVLSLGLTAGTTYYIIVDGYTTSSDLSGPYTITLTSP